jgi:uncharacterized protein YdaU (DUF1376 family)
MCEFAYMKLYPGDFLADTLDLNRADLGSYMLLLMAMWRQGGELPFEPKSLARICRVRRDWPKTWERLKRFFIVSEDGKTISQKRLTSELEAARKKQDKYAETRAQRAQNEHPDAQQNVHSKSRKPLNDNDPTSQRARASPVPSPVQNERTHSDRAQARDPSPIRKRSFRENAFAAIDLIVAASKEHSANRGADSRDPTFAYPGFDGVGGAALEVAYRSIAGAKR